MSGTIAGLPVSYSSDAAGIYTTVAFQNVVIEGSPLVVNIDPPIADISRVEAVALLALVAAIANGAIIVL